MKSATGKEIELKDNVMYFVNVNTNDFESPVINTVLHKQKMFYYGQLAFPYDCGAFTVLGEIEIPEEIIKKSNFAHEINKNLKNEYGE